jgi:hypothetical protein
MRKWIDIALRIVLSLILLLPVFGVLGIFPPPTADLYNTPEAFSFIETLENVRYISIIMAIVHIAALACLWSGRVALAALLILPITVNVIAFHLFLDGGPLKAGSVPADVMLVINVYLLWQQRRRYTLLLERA